MPSHGAGPRGVIRLALVLSLGLAGACAVVEPPPGGPVDMTPPQLTAVFPDSGATGVGNVNTLRLTFSEKMDRTSAVSWLHFFPDQRIRQTKWHGAVEAEVILESPLPADTVIVVEVAADMRDAHKVKGRQSRRFPIATGDAIPAGSIGGVLIMADSAVTNAVLELYDVPPDSLEYFQQPLLRRTVTDKLGAYRFDWLPVPGGPWLVRAFADPDNNLRPGDNEAQRLIPDTLRLAADEPVISAGVTTLYAYDTPGRILLDPFEVPGFAGPLAAWTLPVAQEDTGWVPAPRKESGSPVSWIDPAGGGAVTGVKPGPTRIVFFVDVDGDSTFSPVPDSLMSLVPDSLRAAAADSAAGPAWFLEPWFLVEGIDVVPGLDTSFTVPAVTFSFTPWTEPAPAAAAPDSGSAAGAAPSVPPEEE